MPIPDLFQVMAEELTRARADKLFPPTTAPTTDVQSTAHDYELLLQLQHARNMASSEAYDKLRVEVARRVRDRDEPHDQEANRDEAVRRVESYLRSLEHEKEHYESLSSGSLSPPTTPSVPSRCGGGCSTPKVNEEVLSICEQAVEQALNDVAGPLLEGVEHHADLNEEQQELRNEQKALHHQQAALVEGQKLMVADHSDNNRAQRSLLDEHGVKLDHLAGHVDRQEHACVDMEAHVRGMGMIAETSARNFFVLQNMLAATTALNSHLSQTVVNLPQAINDVVEQAIQQQVTNAVTSISKAYQAAISNIEEQRQSQIGTASDPSFEQCRCCSDSSMAIGNTSQNRRSSKGRRLLVNSSLTVLAKKLRRRL